ncbi:MAG: DNA primase [Bacteroidota bacterium]
MAARAEIIEEIRAKTDLVRLVGEYVPLRKNGRRFVGLCPFHQEKTPSFSVNPEGQFFYCFGCKASGDVFEFVMRLEGLDFLSSARLLAERAGLKWEAHTPEEAEREKRRNGLLRLNAMAAEIYRRALAAPQTGARGRQYLAARGLDSSVLDRFRLGYAPSGPRTLVQVLRRYGCRLEDAAAIGLVIPTAAGYIDRFRDRLIFPLIDLRDRVVGFGGRGLGPGQQPKYLNSPESELFNKGRFLYALHLAREAIRRAGVAIIVEGYFDAIAAQKAGYGNVIATLGTAISETQAELLKRFAPQIVIAYDGDTAGQTATVRGLEIARRAGLEVRVAVMPPGQDPDELLRQQGVESFGSLVAASLPLTEFLLSRALAAVNPVDPESRAAGVKACLPALAEVSSASARDGYIRQVARHLHIHEELVASDLAVYLRNRRKERHIMDNARQDSNTNRCDILTQDSSPNAVEKELLRTILKEYSLIARIREELNAEDFSHGPLRDIFALMLRQPANFTANDLVEQVSEESRPVLLELLAAAAGEYGPPLRPESLPEYVRRIKVAAIRRELQELQAEIDSPGNGDDRATLMRRYMALQHELARHKEDSGFIGI